MDNIRIIYPLQAWEREALIYAHGAVGRAHHIVITLDDRLNHHLPLRDRRFMLQLSGLIFRNAAALHGHMSRLYETISTAERDEHYRENLDDIMRHIRRSHRSMQEKTKFAWTERNRGFLNFKKKMMDLAFGAVGFEDEEARRSFTART
ncbi:unnamed protein product [Caenorhabditis angaria]|uniref:Uncharacterized protein n=1 Tax=Caenorhabditis angaria TaxID=860376 RepID=A0A9P1J415_9PELO|nr:unnamed protein product [Caenorhabditis angaria]